MKMIVLVSSCDDYSDCWLPFYKAFQSAWPTCPYPVRLITNSLQFTPDDKADNFSCIPVGTDKGWASNLQHALDTMVEKPDYLLYMQEDYWLSTKIEDAFIREQLDYAVANQLDCLRLTFPWNDIRALDGMHASSLAYEHPYAICLQAAIWKTTSLERLLVSGWSGWDFESKVLSLGVSSLRVQVLLEKVSRNYFHYVDAVRKGRWTRDGVKYQKKWGGARSRQTRGGGTSIYMAHC